MSKCFPGNTKGDFRDGAKDLGRGAGRKGGDTEEINLAKDMHIPVYQHETHCCVSLICTKKIKCKASAKQYILNGIIQTKMYKKRVAEFCEPLQ